MTDLNEPGLRLQIGRRFDVSATKQNYDTTHTSRPDAVPMWDDLTYDEQTDIMREVEAEGDLHEYGEVEWLGGEAAVIESETNPWLRTPGGTDIDLVEFAKLRGVDMSDECDQCGTLMRGVIEGMDSNDGIQRCDQCEIYDGDLEAARALRDAFMPAGTTIWFNGTN